MPDADVSVLVGGVITRASFSATGGMIISVSQDNGHYVVQAEACHCGKLCDMTHITVTKING